MVTQQDYVRLNLIRKFGFLPEQDIKPTENDLLNNWEKIVDLLNMSDCEKIGKLFDEEMFSSLEQVAIDRRLIPLFTDSCNFYNIPNMDEVIGYDKKSGKRYFFSNKFFDLKDKKRDLIRSFVSTFTMQKNNIVKEFLLSKGKNIEGIVFEEPIYDESMEYSKYFALTQEYKEHFIKQLDCLIKEEEMAEFLKELGKDEEIKQDNGTRSKQQALQISEKVYKLSSSYSQSKLHNRFLISLINSEVLITPFIFVLGESNDSNNEYTLSQQNLLKIVMEAFLKSDQGKEVILEKLASIVKERLVFYQSLYKEEFREAKIITSKGIEISPCRWDEIQLVLEGEKILQCEPEYLEKLLGNNKVFVDAGRVNRIECYESKDTIQALRQVIDGDYDMVKLPAYGWTLMNKLVISGKLISNLTEKLAVYQLTTNQ